jgi:hypothetical protein
LIFQTRPVRRLGLLSPPPNAWKAVDAWNQANAFNEPIADRLVDLPDHVIDWDAAWTALCDWLNFAVGDPGLNDSDIQTLWQTLLDFQKGGVSIESFKRRLQEIYVTD